MSQTTPPPAAPAAVPGKDDLHIVLFGLPAAGKSSLLGALAQAAAAQEHLLHGRLSDPSHGLAELRQRLYEESPRRTSEEVVPYPVAFEPFDRDGPKEPLRAVVIDCDGRVANDLLVRRQDLDESSPEGTLAYEVVEADALLLVVDASAPPAQIEADFNEFDRFLRQMEGGRARRTEVAGLPVFLVLTKCDLLAQTEDNSADWVERIEQRKRDVDARFRSFLARREKEGAVPFGRLDLHVWATAVKRPALAGTPPRPREPYGVAELFRLCLEEADAFRARSRRARRRLLWTVALAAALVGAMLVLSITLLIQNRARQTDALQARVEDFRVLDSGGPAERLRGGVARLREKQARLQSIHDDPLFGALPESSRQFVDERLAELKEYTAYLERVEEQPRPGSLRSEGRLQEVKERLAKLTPPRPEWEKTDAAKLRRERLDEAEKLADAVAQARKRFADLRRDAQELKASDVTAADWPKWARKAKKLLASAREQPLGAKAVELHFDTVQVARAEWVKEEEGLKRLLELTAALGLVTVEGRPAPLAIPEDVDLEEVGRRARELRQAYRDPKVLGPDDLPSGMAPALRQAARKRYEHLLRPGQAEVRKKYRVAGKDKEEDERWQAVRRWLATGPPELASWSELAWPLLRLANPEAKEPVPDLAEFLAQKQFVLEVRSLTLVVPEGVKRRLREPAELKVYHPASGRQPALRFKPAGDPVPDRRGRTWTYRYEWKESDKPIVYRPRDNLWARVDRADGRALMWWPEVQARSMRYQFECLLRPPLLRSPTDKPDAGDPEDEVRLTFVPDSGVPRVPDLLPRVR
jgi:hypothetical protein